MKFLNIIYYIFIAFVVITVILLIVSTFPITGNYKIMTVISGSMEPAIKVGSVVMSKPLDNYKIGDVITFQRRGERDSTTHRIVEARVAGGESVYTTQGDANNAPDIKEVRKSEVLGKVLVSVPYLGYLVAFAQKPIGFFLIIIIPAAVIVGDEIKKVYAEIKKNKNKGPVA